MTAIGLRGRAPGLCLALGAAGLAFILAQVGARAADHGEADYARVNAGIAEGHVAPRMAAFAAATEALDGAMARVCAGTGKGSGSGQLGRRFHRAMDAWMAVRHIDFGPAEDFMRASRIQFAPDPDGRAAAAVERLLGERRTGAFDASAFAHETVAAQGFPALERVLFRDDGTPAFAAEPPNAARCRLGRAITVNLKTLSRAMAAAWRPGGAFSRQLTQPGPGSPFFASHKDATLALFKAFHGGFDVIVAIKLEPPLGKTAAAARPDLVENRISGRGLRNIVANLEALAALYNGEGGKPGLGGLLTASGKDPSLGPLMSRAFAQTIATARDIPPPLARAVADPAARPKVEKLLLQVRALRQIIAQRLASALGIALGFNALDGD